MHTTGANEDILRLVRDAVQAIDAGIAIIDRDRTFVWVNTWLDHRYPTLAPLLGSKCYRLICSADEPCDGCPITSAGDGAAKTVHGMPCPASSSEFACIEIEATPLKDAEGNVIGAVAHFHDVSERTRLDREREAAVSALEEEVSRRRLLVEQSRDGIVVLDENGGVWESNEAFATMLGYSPEEVLSLHVWDWECLFPRERVHEMIEAVDSRGDHFMTVHRRKDGSTYEVEISTNGAFYGGKKFIFCVCRDIAEKVRAEREREALISRLQEALAELKTLRGIIPVCSFCKKVRDDRGYWEQVEVYITKNSEANVSHGICPECLKEHFPGMNTRHETTSSHEADMGQGST
jgi:PAS domain S-box-containing protein